MAHNKMIRELLKALESGSYNAPPGRLRSGTIYAPGTENNTDHQDDVLWAKTFGHIGYIRTPEDRQPTPEEQKEIDEAIDEWRRTDGNKMIARMQTPEAKEGVRKAFNATPAELGRAAVEAAKKTK